MSKPTYILLLVLVLAAAMFVPGCGGSGSGDTAEGESVELDGVEFNVTSSRFLDPNDKEDSAYLVGQAASPKGERYLGVFVDMQNESDEVRGVPYMKMIYDGSVHDAFPSDSPYALHFGEPVEPHKPLPVPDSSSQQEPTEGSLVLFRLPAEASENGSLTFLIKEIERKGARVTLDPKG